MVERMIYTAASGEVFEANDARQYIDPDKIKAAIDNVINVVERSSGSIRNKVVDVGDGVKDALSVSDTDIAPTLYTIGAELSNVDVDSQFDGIYEKAVSEYNKLQEMFNEEAKAKADAATAEYNNRMNANM